MALQKQTLVSCSVLTALIRVDQQLVRLNPAASEGPGEGLDHLGRAHGPLQLPAEDTPAEQVDPHRQVPPAAGGADGWMSPAQQRFGDGASSSLTVTEPGDLIHLDIQPQASGKQGTLQEEWASMLPYLRIDNGPRCHRALGSLTSQQRLAQLQP